MLSSPFFVISFLLFIFVVCIPLFLLWDNGYLLKVKTMPCPKPHCDGVAKETGWSFGWGEASIYKCQKCKIRVTLVDGKLTLPPLNDDEDQIPIYERPLYVFLHGF